MTEDEAKAKWCFAAVASHTNPRGGFETPEQLGDAPPYSKTFPCIASACMAWRTKWKVSADGLRTEGFQPDGYCGLAGAPQ